MGKGVKMASQQDTERSARSKRVRRLKKMIVITLVVSILLPTILCVVLFIRVNSLSETLELMTDRLDHTTALLEDYILQSQTGDSGGGQAPEAGTVTEAAMDSINGLYDSKKVQPAGAGSQEPGDQLAGGVSGGNEVSTGDASQPQHKVYLTFDDGPSIYTYDILDILDRYGVKATFFVLGKEDEKSQEELREIVSRGHTLGMHSYSHKYAELYRSLEDFAEDFLRLKEYLYVTTGVESVYYRFPGGSSNTVSDIDMWEFADYLEEQNTRFYDWNISSGDGGSKMLSVQTLVDNCLQGIEDRETNIILMHDSAAKRTTVEALPMIIENILALENTVILPITEDTEPVQHIHKTAMADQ